MFLTALGACVSSSLARSGPVSPTGRGGPHSRPGEAGHGCGPARIGPLCCLPFSPGGGGGSLGGGMEGESQLSQGSCLYLKPGSSSPVLGSTSGSGL